MNRRLQRVKEFIARPAAANLAALLGGLVYLVQTIWYAFTQESMIDEGLYLFKGLLYASNAYHPYQDYGPWTHKAPFAYLIPGSIQAWFGPGLETGRYFSILISLLGLLGLWLVARRLGKHWWAAAAVWVMATNPAIIKFYSIASAEGLVFCLLVWSLFLAMGEDRSTWQIVLSGFLASVLSLTRQNMMPVLPLLLAYILWQHGWKRFGWAAAASALVFLAVHIAYWPGILRLWAPALPASLTPFLDPWRPPRGVVPGWDTSLVSTAIRVETAFRGLRFHFIALASGVASLAFWPRKAAWKSQSQFRLAVFLAAAFVVLGMLHLWLGTGNSESNNYNAWAFPAYASFFESTGLLLFIVCFPTWRQKVPALRQVLAFVLAILIILGAGSASLEPLAMKVMEMPVPRVQDFFHTWRVLPGTVPLWSALTNKFGGEFLGDPWFYVAMLGLGLALIFTILYTVVWQILRRKQIISSYAFTPALMIIILLAGFALSPTPLLGGGFTEYDCGGNVIASFEEAGQSLAAIIPPGSTVYWSGTPVAILLYIPDVHIYPAQLDGVYSYWLGGDDDALARYGFWNDSLMQQWKQEADYFVILQRDFTPEWEAFLYPTRYEELEFNNIPLSCSADTYLRIFRKK